MFICLQAGNFEHTKSLGPEGLDAHKAAVIGDTIGDPSRTLLVLHSTFSRTQLEIEDMSSN